jgi:hypothetical protein
MSLKDALEFYDKVDALKFESNDRIAVGTDHIEWLVKATRTAVEDLKLLDECIAHLDWTGFGDSYERECAKDLIEKVEAYDARNDT